MFIVWGRRYYGKVDAVPGLFHVKTVFGHLYWIPLLPQESVVVREDIAGAARLMGKPIPLCWKSIVVTYVRLLLGFLVILFGVMTYNTFNSLQQAAGGRHEADLQTELGVQATILGVSSALFLLTYRMRRADARRAFQLAAVLGLPPELVARHFPEGEQWLALGMHSGSGSAPQTRRSQPIHEVAEEPEPTG